MLIDREKIEGLRGKFYKEGDNELREPDGGDDNFAERRGAIISAERRGYNQALRDVLALCRELPSKEVLETIITEWLIRPNNNKESYGQETLASAILELLRGEK